MLQHGDIKSSRDWKKNDFIKGTENIDW